MQNKFYVYSKDGCGFCDRLTQFMESKGVEFEKFNLGEDYSHFQFDLRLSLGARWGAVFFGGVGCLYGEDVSARSSSCQDNVYPALGGGISYLLKPETGIVVRAEVAKGTGDNSALYLRFGHPF